jgi:glucose-1-phosphate thymidylyltransferase
MAKPFKIVIPMAGFGTRMRPHTWSRPKPLVSAAGNTILGHVLTVLESVPNFEKAELVFIVGYLGEQVREYMSANFPVVKATFVKQEELLGQSHAIAMAREYMTGPTLVVFVDTLIDADFSFLADEEADAVIWVKEVDDPRRFGVVSVDDEGWVRDLIEKPDSYKNNLAIVGIYYFKRGEDLIAAIDEQIAGDVKTKNEFFIADAISLMLEKGLRLRPAEVDVWLDAGVPATVLETNRHLLQEGHGNSAEAAKRPGVEIKAPVYIHPSAKVEDSTIGPNVSVGANCVVKGSQIENSLLEAEAQVLDSQLHASLLGKRSQVAKYQGSLNIGDDSQVEGEKN